MSGNGDFEELISYMPRIAEAINTFQSEEVQREAFRALVSTLETAEGHPPHAKEQTSGGDKAQQEPEPPTPQGAAQKKRTRRALYAPKMIKNLELSPAGKLSFKDFASEKQPTSNEDKYAVIVFYFEHYLEIKPVTLDQIFTVFRLTSGWREPKDIQSGVRVAASRKGTLNYASSTNISTTPHGRNLVEADLPAKKTGK